MNSRASLIIFSLIFVAGCSVNHSSGGKVGSLEYRRIACDNVVNYDGRKIGISGIEVPISVSDSEETIKIGEYVSSPALIRETSDLIETLDLAQLNACRDLLALKTDEAKLKAMRRRDRLILLLTQTITSLNTVTSEPLIEKDVQETQTELEEILMFE